MLEIRPNLLSILRLILSKSSTKHRDGSPPPHRYTYYVFYYKPSYMCVCIKCMLKLWPVGWRRYCGTIEVNKWCNLRHNAHTIDRGCICLGDVKHHTRLRLHSSVSVRTYVNITCAAVDYVIYVGTFNKYICLIRSWRCMSRAVGQLTSGCIASSCGILMPWSCDNNTDYWTFSLHILWTFLAGGYMAVGSTSWDNVLASSDRMAQRGDVMRCVRRLVTHTVHQPPYQLMTSILCYLLHYSGSDYTP